MSDATVNLILAATVVIITAVYNPTAAQAEQRQASGIKIGAGRLHPSIEVESAFVTNPGRLPSETDPANDIVMVARPGVELGLPSETLDFYLKGDFEYRQYLGIDNSSTKDLSSFAGGQCRFENQQERSFCRQTQ
ncbi:MAG: hypothetical protein R3C68_00790 [Myxococcota bacterium]